MKKDLAAGVFITLLATNFVANQTAAAQAPQRSPAEWVLLGEALHGGFGSHIAVGMRIGQDALQHLGAQPREVDVSVTEGKLAPCACVADGVALATAASPGQRSLTVAPKSDDASFMAIIDVRNRKTGATARYRIPASAIGPLARMNPGQTPEQRYLLAMQIPADQLYSFSLLTQRETP